MAKLPIENKLNSSTLKEHVTIDKHGLIITLTIKPNVSKEKIYLNEKNDITLSVRSQALENAANIRVIEILSEIFHLPKSKIEIISGHKSRIKRILLRDLTLDHVL